ncbi:MAG: hypothetical protein ACE5HP_07470 [Gemmatimonadota bacterium]
MSALRLGPALPALVAQSLGEYGGVTGAWSDVTEVARDVWSFGSDHLVELVAVLLGLLLLERFLRP